MARGKAASQYSESPKKGKKKEKKNRDGKWKWNIFYLQCYVAFACKGRVWHVQNIQKKQWVWTRNFFFFNYFIGNTCYNFWVRLTFHWQEKGQGTSPLFLFLLNRYLVLCIHQSGVRTDPLSPSLSLSHFYIIKVKNTSNFNPICTLTRNTTIWIVIK